MSEAEYWLVVGNVMMALAKGSSLALSIYFFGRAVYKLLLVWDGFMDWFQDW